MKTFTGQLETPKTEKLEEYLSKITKYSSSDQRLTVATKILKLVGYEYYFHSIQLYVMVTQNAKIREGAQDWPCTKTTSHRYV